MKDINTTNKKYDIFIKMLVIVFFVVLNIVDIASINVVNKNIVVLFLFDLIGIISLMNILFVSKRVNSFVVINFFCFVFFYYAGIKQYLTNTIIWNDFFKVNNITSDDYIFVNLMIIAFLILYSLSYFKSVKRKHMIIEKNDCDSYKKVLNLRVLNFLTIINVIILILFLRIYGFSGLLSRYSSEGKIKSQIVDLILNYFIRFIPVSSLILMINTKMNAKSSLKKYYLILNSLIVLILVFPLGGTPRFMIAGVYMAILYPVIRMDRFKTFFVFSLFFCFFVFFPTINFFRYNPITEIKNLKIAFMEYDTGHVDAYSMILYIKKYIDINGIGFGKNIFTAILFFIPRSIWSGKAVGTGSMVAAYYSSSFTNVSAPLIAEMYYSFGVFGVLFLTIFVGKLSRYLDINAFSKSIFISGVSAIFFGMILFIMRGDLLSSYSYTIGYLLSFIVVYEILSLLGGRVCECKPDR